MNAQPQSIESSIAHKDASGAMHDAILSEDTETIKALLARDANLASTPVGDYDDAPVMFAAKEGKARSLDTLLTAGGAKLVKAAANHVDDTTPLMSAASRGHAECVRLLLPHSDANAADLGTKTALMHAVSSGPRKSDANYAQCVDLLLPVSDATLTDWAGNNALALAAAGGRAGRVEQLLAVDGGALARTSNNTGWTPLMHAVWAVGEKASEGARLLLPHSDLDATIAETDEWTGRSALMLAARSPRPDLVEALLAAGADATLADENGWTALHFAADAGDERCIDLLLPFIDAAAANRDGETPLMFAAEGGRTQCVERLLTAGGANLANGWGDTALVLASDRGHTECVKRLIAAGSDVHATNTISRDNALMMAASRGHLDIVRVLAPLGGTKVADVLGDTALMNAALDGNREVVEALLPFSDPLAINDRGESAFARAAGSGHFECADALARHSNPLEVAKIFKEAGAEKMPQWAAHVEREELAAVVARTEAAQARSAVASTPLAPTGATVATTVRRGIRI